MLLALGRRYVCRTRTGNHHALYLLFSQFSASPPSMTTTSAQGQGGGTISPTPLFSNTSNMDWRAHNRKKDPQFHLDSLFNALRFHLLCSFEQEDGDDYGIRTPTEAVDASFKFIGCPGFQPSESFVLKVLSTYGNTEGERSLSSYLALFEWAGEQTGFLHTPKTFDALNKILAGSNPILLKDLVNVLDFGHYRACLYNTLFVAYLIARLPGLAYHILGSRLLLDEGLNAPPASYNKLVNVLLQHKSFAEADAVLDSLFYDGQISLEPNNIINIRTTTPTNLEANNNREYLRGLARSGDPFEARFLGGHALITLVCHHCESKRFKDAVDLIDEFKELSSFNSNYPYEIWITSAYSYAESCSADQMQTAHEAACNLDTVVGYTTSLIRHVMENRFEAASQLLMEMKELKFIMPPRKPTVSELMYHFLLNLLCGGGGYESVVEAESNCCKEGNFDRLIQVLRLHFGFRPGTPCLPGAFRNFLYNKLISALCRAGRVEDAYLLYGEFNKACRRVFDGEICFDEVISTTDETYYHMINGFRKINREDVADRLLLEMLEPLG